MMTREEATKYAESKKMILESLIYNDDCKYGNYAMYSAELSFINAVLSALRPVSREQVEKVWRGEWIWDTSGLYPKPVCSKCGEEPYRRSNHTSDLPNYCPKCGAPMTDEAVDIIMKRLEALHESIHND